MTQTRQPAIASGHPLRRLRSASSALVSECAHKLNGAGGDQAEAHVRCALLMRALDLRTPSELTEELASNHAASWFIGAKSLADIRPRSLAAARIALRKDARGALLIAGLETMLLLDELARHRRGLRRARRPEKKNLAMDREFQAQVLRATELWSLTPRQLDVLALVVRGNSNREIAAKIKCAPGTVELHVTALLQKSRSPTRSSLVARFWIEV